VLGLLIACCICILFLFITHSTHSMRLTDHAVGSRDDLVEACICFSVAQEHCLTFFFLCSC
jgi:hypothetical protein